MATGLSKKKIDLCISKLGMFCNYCGLAIASENFSIDHLMPKSKGGTNSQDNLILACRKCNSSKGTKTLENYRIKVFLKKHGIYRLTLDDMRAVEEYMGKRFEVDHLFFFERVAR